MARVSKSADSSTDRLSSPLSMSSSTAATIRSYSSSVSTVLTTVRFAKRASMCIMMAQTCPRLFECIRTEMEQGSPEGDHAKTGFCEPAQKPQTGEPYERPPLYRIRCTQEDRQLLREDCRRDDRGGKQAGGDAPGTAPVGRETAGAAARRGG